MIPNGFRSQAPVFLALALATACAPAVQSTSSARTAPPDDVFTCYMRELARMEYRVEDSDRGAGFIRAILEDGGLLRGEYGNEATVSILPAGSGAEVNVTMRRVRISGDGGRSTAGMAMNGAAQEDLAHLEGACHGADGSPSSVTSR